MPSRWHGRRRWSTLAKVEAPPPPTELDLQGSVAASRARYADGRGFYDAATVWHRLIMHDYNRLNTARFRQLIRVADDDYGELEALRIMHVLIKFDPCHNLFDWLALPDAVVATGEARRLGGTTMLVQMGLNAYNNFLHDCAIADHLARLQVARPRPIFWPTTRSRPRRR